MVKRRLAGFLAVVFIAQAATGCAFGFDYGITGAAKLTTSAAVDEPTEDEGASNPIAVAFLQRPSAPPASLRIVPASFKSTVLAQRNNGECETNADCYEDQGYYCEKNESCEGRCGTCWRHPTDDSDGDGSGGSAPASSGGSAPASSSSGGGGGGSVWAWGLLGLGVIVLTVVLLANSIKKSKQTQ